ncbi:MAG: nucleoside phosphorylase [Candidatus Acidiferrum sp.]
MDKVLHLKATAADIGAYVFLCGDPSRVAAISKYFDEQREVSTARGYVIHSGKLAGERVSVVASGIGGPSTAIAVEELIALGARTFLRVGTCGSLQSNVKIGDTIISTAAVREEGTTRQYIAVEYPAVASWDVVQSLVQSCRRAKAKFHIGLTHCKDAFYSELPEYTADPEGTERRWNGWSRGNVLCTEMEASTIYVIASMRNCRAGALLHVVGSTIEGNLITKAPDIEPVLEIAIAAMNLMITNDLPRA